eukprot:403716_1
MIIWWLFCLTLQIEKSIHHFEIVNNAQNRTFPKWQSLSNVTKLSIKMQPHHTTCKNNWVNNINRILIAPNNLSFSQNQYISDKIPITQQTQHEMNQYHFPYNRRYFNNSNNIYTKSTLRFDSVYKFHFNDSHVSTNYPILPHDTDMNYMDKISTLESSQFIDPKEFICTTRATNTNNNTYTYTQYIICSSKSVTYVFRIYKHSKNVVVNAQNVYGFEIYMRPYIQVNHIIENIGNKYRHYKLATTNAHKQPVTSILLALTWQPKVLINLFLLGSFFAFMVCRRSEKHQSIARIARNVFTFDEWYTITIKTLLFLFISFSTSTESIIYATILMTGSLYLFKNGKHSSIKLLLSSLCITMVYATEYSTVDPTVKQSIDSNSPTLIPTSNPSIQQTTYPTFNPTSIPSILPTAYPTFNPSLYPSIYPTRISTLAEKSLFLRNEGCDFGYCTSSTTIDYEHVCVNQLHVIGDAAATQCCPTQSPTNNPTQSPTKHTNTPTFSPLTGPVSPIVGVISCGETKYGTLNNNQDLHYYQLTTNGLNDITYTTCESSFDTMLKVYNYQAEDISSTYCIGPIGNYELILDHKDIANGYFSTNLKTTGLENENDPTANTYSIIGNINPVDYLQSDGKYHLKLIFRYYDGSEDILTWKQSSWITDSIITGADLSTIPTQTACSTCDFEGLGLSTSSVTYLDGDGSKHANFWNSVGQNKESLAGIPAFNQKIAFSESLFVLNNVTGNDCNEEQCTTRSNEVFSIPLQQADVYYIQISSFDSFGQYQLYVGCNQVMDFDHLGCWRDKTTKAMELFIGADYTVTLCFEECLNQKYKYFAVQNGSHCFCDDNYDNSTRYGAATNCGIAGTGGIWANDLYHNKYELILDHKNITNGYFSTNLKTTGLENENDPTANTYSIIGNINPVDYLQSDGKYHLKLIFRYSDGSKDILTWKQSSWITDSIITGADLSTIPTQTACS